MVGCVHPAAGRHVTGSCRDFTLDRVKFRVVCRGNLEIGLESDTQVGLLAIRKICNLHSCRRSPEKSFPFKYKNDPTFVTRIILW